MAEKKTKADLIDDTTVPPKTFAIVLDALHQAASKASGKAIAIETSEGTITVTIG